jgi:hypothetical protein
MVCRDIAVVAAAALFVLTGCGHSFSYSSLNTPSRPLTPREPANVQVLFGTTPSVPFVEVGLFEIEQQTPLSPGTTEMIGKLRERAAEIGCDAVLVTRETDRVISSSGQYQGTATGAGPTYQVQGTTTRTTASVHGLRALCIVYDPPRTSARLP